MEPADFSVAGVGFDARREDRVGGGRPDRRYWRGRASRAREAGPYTSGFLTTLGVGPSLRRRRARSILVLGPTRGDGGSHLKRLDSSSRVAEMETGRTGSGVTDPLRGPLSLRLREDATGRPPVSADASEPTRCALPPPPGVPNPLPRSASRVGRGAPLRLLP